MVQIGLRHQDALLSIMGRLSKATIRHERASSPLGICFSGSGCDSSELSLVQLTFAQEENHIFYQFHASCYDQLFTAYRRRN